MAKVQIQRHYLHHQQYVYEIQEKLINLLNQRLGFNFPRPKSMKKGGLFKKWVFYTESNGLEITSTMEDKHNNYLTIRGNLEKTTTTEIKFLLNNF